MARPRIGQLLVETGLLTKAQLDEAIAAQQTYGGRLGTVIVEHGFVGEDELAHALARQLGLREVTAADLADVPPAITSLLSPAQAERYQVIPFRLDEDGIGLFLAMTDPGNLDRVDEIRFALGRRVEMFLCPEIVMSRGLETYYGIARRMRFIRLHEAAHGRAQREARGQAAASTPASTSVAATTPAPAQPTSAGTGLLTQVATAASPQALIDTMLDALATFSEKVVFLAARTNNLEGWSGRGLDIPPESLPSLRVRIEDSPFLRQAFGSQQATRAALGTDPALAMELCGKLRLDTRESVLLLPLVVGGCPSGAFVLAGPKQGRNADPTLMSELLRRVGWRLQAIQLMECVTAPLAGCP